jgi:hypothetical protein
MRHGSAFGWWSGLSLGLVEGKLRLVVTAVIVVAIVLALLTLRKQAQETPSSSGR